MAGSVKNNISTKNTIMEACILVGIAVFFAFIINALSPNGIALIGKWDKESGVVHADAKNSVVKHELEIGDVKLAKKIYDADKSIFVDARSEDDYNDGHIKGAVFLPVHRFDQLIDGFKNKYSSEATIITYCSGRTCEDSHQLAQLLFSHGYFNVSVFIDGYPDWKEEGYPIE